MVYNILKLNRIKSNKQLIYTHGKILGLSLLNFEIEKYTFKRYSGFPRQVFKINWERERQRERESERHLCGDIFIRNNFLTSIRLW